MSNIDKQALRYGDNVLWFLNELAAYDAGDIDGGEFDVYGEDRNGLEGCSTIDVTELAADAAKLIEAAERRIAELEAREVSIPDYTELYKGPFAMEVEHQVKKVLTAAGVKIAAGIGKGE